MPGSWLLSLAEVTSRTSSIQLRDSKASTCLSPLLVPANEQKVTRNLNQNILLCNRRKCLGLLEEEVSE